MNNVNRPETKKPLINVGAEKASGISFSAAIIAQYVFSFLFLIIVRVVASSGGEFAAEDWYIYCSYLIPQLAFLVTARLYFSRTEARLKEMTKKPRPVYFIVAVALQCGLFSLSFVNTLFLQWLEKFGYTPASPVLPSMQGAKILPVLLVTAVLPACLEELFFRGILLRGMKKFGTVAAVFYGAALFSLYHQSPAQTAYQFICGACFALIALRSGSILPTAVAHFINNATIVILTACGVESFPGFLICIFAALFIASLAYLLFFDKREEKTSQTLQSDGATPARQGETGTRRKADVKGFTLCALAGIVLCLLTWIAGLIA